MKPDKIKHAVVGLFLGAAGALISPVAGIALPVVAGLAKEGWDAAGHGEPEEEDFWATALGGLVGCLVIVTVKGVLG